MRDLCRLRKPRVVIPNDSSEEGSKKDIRVIVGDHRIVYEILGHLDLAPCIDLLFYIIISDIHIHP